jgi:hypothetical protein
MPTLEDSLFVESLRRSELLPAERMTEVLGRVDPRVTPEAFARALVERNYLTPFQADELQRGNYRRLKIAYRIGFARIPGCVLDSDWRLGPERNSFTRT